MDERTPLLVHLLKGILYRDTHPKLYQGILRLRDPVADYVAVIGLELHLDETEGYAFLRQRQLQDVEGDALPRLVNHRPLSYPLSLLCVLLRKRLAETDAAGGETRVILSRDQIVDMLVTFLPHHANEARIIDKIDEHIHKMVDYGFLRELKGQAETYEVRRILKALVDVEWLSELDEKLRSYADHALGQV